MGYKIFPLNTGFIRVDKGTHVTWGRNVGEKVEIPATAWYITNGREKIMVDTGMCDTERANKYHHPGSFQPPGYRVDEQLRKIGVDVRDIDVVIFTHLHWDHCSNIKMFVNAKFLVNREEFRFAKNPLPPYYRSYESPKIGLNPPFEGVEFEFVDGEFRYNDEIVIFPTPGHSPGHQSVSVKTDRGIYIIAGDAVFSEDNLKGIPEESLPFIPIGRFVNFFDMWNSLHEVTKRGDYILPGHDVSVFKQPFYPPD